MSIWRYFKLNPIRNRLLTVGKVGSKVIKFMYVLLHTIYELGKTMAWG